jgi:hypothetical protein
MDRIQHVGAQRGIEPGGSDITDEDRFHIHIARRQTPWAQTEPARTGMPGKYGGQGEYRAQQQILMRPEPAAEPTPLQPDNGY